MAKISKLLDPIRLEEILMTFEQINPNPKIDLEHHNVFTLLIAVLLSAQSTDKIVNVATRNIFNQYDNPYEITKLTELELMEKIKIIGLFRTKAKNIIKLSRILIEKHGGNVPNNFQDLIALPGVGRKTADVVLNSGFGLPTIAVDRHIYRIVHRIGITTGKNVDEVADNLLKIIPDRYKLKTHHWLVLHGRYVCTAIKPKCTTCRIKNICLYGKKNLTS